MRVLLVEDDPTIAAFVAKGLEEAGFAVDHAADGKSGLEAALRTPYDVAVSTSCSRPSTVCRSLKRCANAGRGFRYSS
jgi:DNA-binding response OmpR family regulator